jgi:triacylglycerol lipase
LSLYNLNATTRKSFQNFFTLDGWSIETAPRAESPQGTFVGTVLDDLNHPVPIEAFLGIPYAQPPVGQLRFAKPVPVENRNGTFQATEYSARCPGKQLLSIPGTPQLEADEDCLTLNIFRWRGSFPTAKLPVLVYIHGGAYNRGYAAMHDTASMLSWSEEPFLALSFNYRIGALGFLNSGLTEKEGLLNLGLHDQRLVLEWVQQNIESFGGNPDDVTIAGLSAGAHSIGHHILNINEPRTLFHKAIIESGSAISRAVHPATSDLHEEQFKNFVEQVGCADKAEADILPCLRAAPFSAITAAQTAVFDASNPSLRWAWQPVLDADIISRRPLEALRSGEYHKVPILTGFNSNEGSMYVPKSAAKSSDFTDFFSTLLPHLTAAELDTLDALYPDPSKDTSSRYVDTRNLTALSIGPQYKRVEAAYGHYAYATPVRQTANILSSSTPVYLYHWALNRTLLAGANHGDQIFYETMSAASRGVSPAHDYLARAFNAYLTSFVVTGDPNGLEGKKAVDRPEWAVYKQGGESLVFGRGNDEAAGGKSRGYSVESGRDTWGSEEGRFWERVSEKWED